MGRVYSKLMTTLRSDGDLVRFTAMSLAIALALGFIGGAFAALGLTSVTSSPHSLHYGLVAMFAAVVFAAVWCSEDGPARWRPTQISDERLKNFSTTAVSVLVAAGAVALIINCRIGHI
jgi:hypothetical protein